MSAELQNVVSVRRLARVAGVMHLIRAKVNDRPGFGQLCLTFYMCLETSFEHNDDLFMDVLMGRMRRYPWPKYSFVHFELKA